MQSFYVISIPLNPLILGLQNRHLMEHTSETPFESSMGFMVFIDRLLVRACIGTVFNDPFYYIYYQ